MNAVLTLMVNISQSHHQCRTHSPAEHLRVKDGSHMLDIATSKVKVGIVSCIRQPRAGSRCAFSEASPDVFHRLNTPEYVHGARDKKNKPDHGQVVSGMTSFFRCGRTAHITREIYTHTHTHTHMHTKHVFEAPDKPSWKTRTVLFSSSFDCFLSLLLST